jgi:hypothetical protein
VELGASTDIRGFEGYGKPPPGLSCLQNKDTIHTVCVPIYNPEELNSEEVIDRSTPLEYAVRPLATRFLDEDYRIEPYYNECNELDTSRFDPLKLFGELWLGLTGLIHTLVDYGVDINAHLASLYSLAATRKVHSNCRLSLSCWV